MFLGQSCIRNFFTEGGPTSFQITRRRGDALAPKSFDMGENEPASDDASSTFPPAETWNLSFKSPFQIQS